MRNLTHLIHQTGYYNNVQDKHKQINYQKYTISCSVLNVFNLSSQQIRWDQDDIGYVLFRLIIDSTVTADYICSTDRIIFIIRPPIRTLVSEWNCLQIITSSSWSIEYRIFHISILLLACLLFMGEYRDRFTNVTCWIKFDSHRWSYGCCVYLSNYFFFVSFTIIVMYIKILELKVTGQ